MAKKKKSPFGEYSVEDIFASEAVSFIIIAGSDLFDIDGEWLFDERTAVRYHGKILKEVMEQTRTGSKKQKANAMRVLRNLRVERLRIH